MPVKMCCICNCLQQFNKQDWKLVSYPGSFVCSANCMLAWIDKNKGESSFLSKAVELYSRGQGRPPFRSDYEGFFTSFLDSKKMSWEYERYGFYVGSSKTYTPDFFLPKFGVFLETKGRWGLGQKKKMQMFRSQYPEIPLLVISWAIHEDFYK